MPTSCAFPVPAYALTDDLDQEDSQTNLNQATAPLRQHFGSLSYTMSTLGPLKPGQWHDYHLRRDEFITMAQSTNVIWPLRGGHGCLELIPAVLALDLTQDPLLLGFSDISALHACWWQRAWPQIHCYMPAVPHGSRAKNSLANRLAGTAMTWTSNTGNLTHGSTTGPAYISCLRLLAALAGTPAQPCLHGCMLFIEDIDERSYMIDRCLHQCQLAGILDGIVGIVGGCFPIANGRDTDPAVASILMKWGERLAIPTAWGLPFGHDPDPISLSFGWLSKLSVNHQGWELVHQPA